MRTAANFSAWDASENGRLGRASPNSTRVARLYFCYFLICTVHLRSRLLSYVHFTRGGDVHVAGTWRAPNITNDEATARDTAVYGLTWLESNVGPVYICSPFPGHILCRRACEFIRFNDILYFYTLRSSFEKKCEEKKEYEISETNELLKQQPCRAVCFKIDSRVQVANLCKIFHAIVIGIISLPEQK